MPRADGVTPGTAAPLIRSLPDRRPPRPARLELALEGRGGQPRLFKRLLPRERRLDGHVVCPLCRFMCGELPSR
jgi:hypothetical protein